MKTSSRITLSALLIWLAGVLGGVWFVTSYWWAIGPAFILAMIAWVILEPVYIRYMTEEIENASTSD